MSNGAPPGAGSQNGGPVVLELPLDKIRRPLMRTRANDPNKVQELMDSIRENGLQVPIDVLEVDGVYYGMCSCTYGLNFKPLGSWLLLEVIFRRNIIHSTDPNL